MFTTDYLEIEWKIHESRKRRQLSARWGEAIWSAWCGWANDWIFAALNSVGIVCRWGLRERYLEFGIDAARLFH